jgi:hypothetical protein
MELFGSLAPPKMGRLLAPDLRSVQRDSRDYQGQPGKLRPGWELSQDDNSHRGGHSREKRYQQREACGRQPFHSELVAHLGDHRRGDTDSGGSG